MIALGLVVTSARALAEDRTLFMTSAVEYPDGTVTLPLYRGTSHGDTVYYVILDTSDGELSQALGVNRSDKLANARGSTAVQNVTYRGGLIDFPASVDFRQERVVDAPNGFPPTKFQPGAVGEAGYSPLIQLPNGTIVNAPQIARDQDHDGRIAPRLEAADKVVSIDPIHGTVTYRETEGFQGGRMVRYISTDSSNYLAATLEDATFAPALDAAPTAGDDSTHSSRASLAAFVNGRTAAANRQRQGLNSAVAGDGDPLNVLRWNPSQGRAAIAGGQNVRQSDWGDVQGLVDSGLIAGPGGARFGPAGIIVDCPIVSRD